MSDVDDRIATLVKAIKSLQEELLALRMEKLRASLEARKQRMDNK